MILLPDCPQDEADRLQPSLLFELMKTGVQATLRQAEHRGDWRAVAFIRGNGRPPLGIVERPELNDKPLRE